LADAEDKLIANPSSGMVNPVELNDFLNRLADIVHDLEKVEIFRRDEPELEETLGQKFHPRFPVSALGPIEQHDRNDPRFPGLHEREHLKGFVHRAETAWEKPKSMRLFHEVEFAGEEVIEVDQLSVAFDDLIGVLLEGEPDVEAETALASGATLGRVHDAVAATGDDHVILFDHLARKFFRDLKLRCVCRRPRRTKNDDLSKA